MAKSTICQFKCQMITNTTKSCWEVWSPNHDFAALKHQKSTTEYADNLETLVGRGSVQLSCILVNTGWKNRDEIKVWRKASHGHPLWINNMCVYHFQYNLCVIGYVGYTCQHLLAVNWRTQGICNRKPAEGSARYYVPKWHCINVNDSGG